MPLGEIKHNIEEQARREARGIHEDADNQKNSIIGEASARVKEISQRVEKSLDEDIKRLGYESDSSAELESKNIMLGAREDAIAEEVSKVKRLLVAQIRKSKSYEKIFKAALKQARNTGSPDELTVIVAKRDRPMVEKFGAKIEVQNLSGGLIITSKSGDMEINATLDKIVESKTDVIRNAVLGEMFGKERKAMPAAKAAKPKPARKRKK